MDKPLQIAFKGTDSSEFFETLIREHVARLEQRYPRIVGCRVVVEIPQRAPETGKVPIEVAVEVEVPGTHMLVARATDDRREMKQDHAAVVNRAFEAIIRRLDHLTDVRNRETKRHEAAVETGQVIRLFREQNYGFIEVIGAPELYFTRNAVKGGSFDDIDIGTLVEITRATTEGPMGPQASSVRVLNTRHSPA